MKSRDRLIQLFQQADRDFDIEALAISPPYQTPVDSQGNNTSIVIKPKNIKSGYIGSKTWTYYRRELPILFNSIVPLLDLREVKTHEQAIEMINRRFDLGIHPEEFEEQTPTIEDGYKLVAKANNYEYVGQIQFKHALPLSSTKRVVLMGFNYPSPDRQRIQAPMYSANLDTIESRFLTQVKVGDSIAIPLFQRLLNLWSTDHWDISTSSSEFNLQGATVTAHDVTEKGDTTHHVVKCTLSDLCSNMAGELIFKFNSKLKEKTSADVDFTSGSTVLSPLPSYQPIDNDTLTKLNDLLTLYSVTSPLTIQHTIVYNGTLASMPDIYLPYVALNKQNVCVIVNGYDESVAPIILSY